jgi:hypothetical protein
MPVTIEDIRAVRAELQKFDFRQTDFAVRFHIAVVDANLRAASEGHDDPISREGLALCVKQLAASISNPGRGCGSVRCMFCQAALKAITPDAIYWRITPQSAGRRSTSRGSDVEKSLPFFRSAK